MDNESVNQGVEQSTPYDIKNLSVEEFLNLALQSTKKVMKDAAENEPRAYLNKSNIRFTKAAIELLEVQPGDKVLVMFDKQNNIIVHPKNEKGNKLNEKLTIYCTGVKNKLIAEKGSIFRIEQLKVQNGKVFTLSPIK